MFKTNRATSHSQWVRTRQHEFRPLGPALVAWCGHHGRPGPHCWECAEGGSLGLTGHQPCWKTASSGFTERVFQENKADPQKKVPEFSPGLNTHVHTHADTIHTKGHKVKCAESLHWSQCTPPPGPVCHHHSPVSLFASGPSLGLPTASPPCPAVPHPAQGSVPASAVPLVNGIVVSGTCLTWLWSWEAGLFDTGNDVSSGLASGKCPQCSLLWGASHTAAHGTNCPLVLDFHILESRFISLRL